RVGRFPHVEPIRTVATLGRARRRRRTMRGDAVTRRTSSSRPTTALRSRPRAAMSATSTAGVATLAPAGAIAPTGRWSVGARAVGGGAGGDADDGEGPARQRGRYGGGRRHVLRAAHENSRATDPARRPPMMRAVVLHEADDMRLIERPVPEPGPGEVLLKVEV